MTSQETRDKEFEADQKAKKELRQSEMNAKWDRENCTQSKQDSRKSALRRAYQAGATYADFIDGSTN